MKRILKLVLLVSTIFINNLKGQEDLCSRCDDISFYFPERICAGEKVYFEKGLKGCTNSPIFKWDFGDGGGLVNEPYHTYNFPGNYIASIVIPATTDCDELSVSKSFTVVKCSEFDCDDHNDQSDTTTLTSECNLVVGISLFPISSNNCPLASSVELQANLGGSYTNPTFYWSVVNTSTISTNVSNSVTLLSNLNEDVVSYEIGGSCHTYITVLVTDGNCTATAVYDYNCCGNCTDCTAQP